MSASELAMHVLRDTLILCGSLFGLAFVSIAIVIAHWVMTYRWLCRWEIRRKAR